MGVFNQWFEALFPRAGALGCKVCFAPLLFLLVYLCANVGLQVLPPTTLWGLLAAAWPALPGSTICHLTGSASCGLAVSPVCPAACLPAPTSLDECFFFISLVVGLPYSSIFCQFWLFFVFKLLSFFRFCEEAPGVYLRRHLGSPTTTI